MLQQYGLFEHLFPQTAAALRNAALCLRARDAGAGLANTDERVAADKPVTPTFLFAVLLWSAVLRELNERQAGPAPDLMVLMQACDCRAARTAVARRHSARFAMPMRELLMLQPRFNRRSGVKSLSLLQHPRFRAAYDFLLLRAQVGVADPELAAWWTDIQRMPQEERVALVQARPAPRARDAVGDAGDAAVGAAARRRRRRQAGRRASLVMSALWRPAYIALGSNLQSARAAVLDEAFARIDAPARRLTRSKRSRLYRLVPWGRRISPTSSTPSSAF